LPLAGPTRPPTNYSRRTRPCGSRRRLNGPRPTPQAAPVGARATTAPRKHWRCRRSALGAALRFKDRFSTMRNEYPISPACPSCSQIMRIARTTPRFGNLPDLNTFECRACGVSYIEAAASPQRRCQTGADCNYKASGTTTAHDPGGITAEVLCSPSLNSAISALSPFRQCAVGDDP
jgi:hypothetical protein